MAESDQNSNADIDGKELRSADLFADRWPGCDRHPQALWQAVSSPMTRASPRPPAATAPSPISTATRASCCTAAIRSISWPGKSHYLEVCYLLLYGELPSAAELEEFETTITRHTMLHEQMQ